MTQTKDRLQKDRDVACAIVTACYARMRDLQGKRIGGGGFLIGVLSSEDVSELNQLEKWWESLTVGQQRKVDILIRGLAKVDGLAQISKLYLHGSD